MNRYIFRLDLAVLCLAWAAPISASPGAQTEPGAVDTIPRPSPEVMKMVENIHWLGHDSFRLEGEGKVIYLDPYQLPAGAPPADLILITHDHSDHCSPADVERIRTPETVVVTVAAAAAKLPKPVRLVGPGDSLVVQGIAVETVPAYNTNKFRSPGKPFHPKEAGYVGFVLTVGGQRIYHTGDSDFIPEMKGLQVDIALLPVSGTYVMTVDEAVQAAAAIQPKLAIPMHVGRGIGALEDARVFAEKATVPVEVLPLEEWSPRAGDGALEDARAFAEKATVPVKVLPLEEWSPRAGDGALEDARVFAEKATVPVEVLPLEE